MEARRPPPSFGGGRLLDRENPNKTRDRTLLATQPLGSRVHTTWGGFLSRAVPSS